MSGGWLPPRPPGDRPPPPPAPHAEPPRPVSVPRAEPSGTSGFGVAAIACAIASLALLVLSLGLSFVFSLPLAGIAWACALRARRDGGRAQGKAGFVLAIAAVVLSTLAALVWIVLIVSGFSVDELQRNLEQELERQRQSAS